MHQLQADASSSHCFVTGDTSPPSRDGAQYRPEAERPSVEPSERMELGQSIENATLVAEEDASLRFPSSNYINTPLPLTAVQPASPIKSQFECHQAIPAAVSCYGTDDRAATPGAVHSSSFDTRGEAIRAANAPNVWPGSPDQVHWLAQDSTSILSPSQLEVSEEDWARSDVGENYSDDNGIRACLNQSDDATVTADTVAGHEERPYTSQLNATLDVSRSSSKEPSVITDAGDQEALRNNRTQPQTLEQAEPAADLTRSLSLLKLTPRHELQESILEAYHRTRDDRSFLPKGELNRLITPESVSRELAKELSNILTVSQIRKFAETICAETTVEHGGKSKIKTFRKIFALLVIAEASSMILLFLEEDVSDLDLPLTPIKNPGIKGFHRKESEVPLKCFEHDNWSPMKLHNFHDHQWKMLATYFTHDVRGDVRHYVLLDKHILPFVALEDNGSFGTEVIGGYGRVFMVHIHGDHHNFPGDTSRAWEPGYAIKQQIETNREAFDREVNVLKKFAGIRGHKHIVSLLATYEHSGKFHFIFPRAEGNLLQFWKEIVKQPNFDYSNVLWMAKQCKGLAEGLFKLHRHLTWTKQQAAAGILRRTDTDSMDEDAPAKQQRVRFDSVADQHHVAATSVPFLNGSPIHPGSPTSNPPVPLENSADSSVQKEGDDDDSLKIYGRHGDINPGNMLWFASSQELETSLRGTLKIADFGQAELNSRFSKTKKRYVPTTITYRPPECDLPPPIIRQEYDIWCLGCVYLEFIAWILGGERLLTKFAKDRLSPDWFQFQDKEKTDAFFQMVQDPVTFERKVVVKEKVVQFIEELHCHENCTEYFHDFLNIIRHDMLVIDSRERKSCKKIARRLRDMLIKCRRDANYAARTNPWTSPQSMRAQASRSMSVRPAEPASLTKEPPKLRRHAQSAPNI